MEVLVVDDEPVARQLTARTLKQAGFEVTTAQDGREALDILAQGKHRLVVADWRMPRMDGGELCRAIRSGPFFHYIYCIILTCQTEPGETIQGLDAGADDYIHKPFNPAELVLRVNIGRRLVALETREMTIFVLAKLAESRDPETGEHLERVRNYCRLIARHLEKDTRHCPQIDAEYIELLYQTSPLHDIGKVAIPDHILLKPGPLTVEEFEIMKTHPLRGAETLDAALDKFPGTRFLEMARDIALSHHERYDGHGYPRGLAGDAIPLSARIMALADVYDALTSRRVYKEPFSHHKTRCMITEEIGKHFDPVIVEAFLACEQDFIAIRDQFAEADDKTPGETGAPQHREEDVVLRRALAQAANGQAVPAG
jgi:putative two-component system response regulator